MASGAPRGAAGGRKAGGAVERPAGLRILIPGYAQWSWRQRERGLVFFGSFAAALAVGLFTWGTGASAAILMFAFVAHVAEWALGRGSDEEPTSAAMAAGIGRSVTVLAWLILLAGVIARGLAAGRVPWGNMYEFGCAAVILMLATYLVLIRRWGRAIDWTGAAVTGVGTVVLGASMLVYVAMAAILAFRPAGLFPVRAG